ncbi:BrnT family toxin [Desulfonema magnum]|uniref:BrnT family toxin n=1 Tax=Desulfonema magnum TaxID=45655 RepID=UPI001A9C1771
MDSFEWDKNKAAKNIKKHRVSFDEAKSVFNDPKFITVVDEEHSSDEERYKYLSKSFLYIFFPRTAEKPGFFLHGRRVIPGKKPGFFPGKY